MADHNGQQLSAREMVRAHHYNRCVDAQVSLRSTSNLEGQQGPGKLIYLKAVQHCEGL